LLLLGVALGLWASIPRPAESSLAVPPGTPSVDVLLQGKRPSSKVAPAFVVADPVMKRTVIAVGRFRRDVLTGLHHVVIVDNSDPEHSLRVFYSPDGEPLRVDFATGWRLDFKLLKKDQSVRVTLRDEKGKKVLVDGDFADLAPSADTRQRSNARSRVSADEPPFESPWRLKQQGFRVDIREIVEGIGDIPGKENLVTAIADLQRFLLKSADDYISRFQKLAVAAGDPAAQAWVVGHAWIKDTLQFAADETGSAAVKVLKTVYDFSRDVKAIDKFIEKPSPGNLAFASNALESISVVAEKAVDFGTALLEGDTVVDVDVPGPEPDPDPGGNDESRKDQVVELAANARGTVASANDCFEFDSSGFIPIVQRRPPYFDLMQTVITQCHGLADITALITGGTKARKTAYDATADLKLAVVNDVSEQVTKVGDVLTSQRANKALIDQLIPQLTDQPAALAAAMAQRSDMERNIATCSSLLNELGALNASIRAVVLP
jgi:hypothetical protein